MFVLGGGPRLSYRVFVFLFKTHTSSARRTTPTSASYHSCLIFFKYSQAWALALRDRLEESYNFDMHVAVA